MGNDNRDKNDFTLRGFDTIVLPIIFGFVVILLALVYWQSVIPKPVLVAYLYPISEEVPNIWLAPVDKPDEARQATFSRMGIYDFAVDTQGQSIAYTMRDEVNLTRDIYILDLDSGDERRLTFCGDASAECFSPVFHPTDPVIAYTRLEIGSPDDDEDTHEHSEDEEDAHAEYDHSDVTISHIWIVDLETGINQTLTNDSDLLGHSPIWSSNGDSIAYYSTSLGNHGVMVYNFNLGIANIQTLSFIPSQNGSVGTLSPDGLQFIIPDIVNRDEQVYTYLRLVDFTETPVIFENFSDPDSPVDDITAEWHPSGERVTISRRYTDERWTRGYQLYEADADTGAVTPLLYDESYGHYFFTWDTLGENLLMQRLPLDNDGGSPNTLARPEIWILNDESGELIKIAESAYFPRWVIPQ